MNEIVNALQKRCSESKASVLVTIVEGSGSSPRKSGSYMVVGQEGRICGTIGGGKLEFISTSTAQSHLAEETGGLTEYRLTQDEVAGLGMACGGNVDVLFTYIAPTHESSAALSSMEKSLEKHATGWLVLPFSGKGLGFLGSDGMSGMAMPCEKLTITALSKGVISTGGNKYFIDKVSNQARVFIFGGGHLAQELVPVLTHIDFRCIVADDRAEFASRELFPDAEDVQICNFEKLEGQFDVTADDYIVTVTRGHMGDMAVEAFALNTPAYYIGVVGSRSKIATVNAKLKEQGFTDSDLARVTTPIGLDIKSDTPAEIAISIAAQLILKRATKNASTNQAPSPA